MSARWLKLPLTASDLEKLSIGEWVNLTGPLITARDQALRRIGEIVVEGKTPPVALEGQLVYFVGPTPAKPGEPIGAAGPTTSRRMEKYLPALLQAGVRALMGKGPLTQEAVHELTRYGAVYLSAAGGAGAYYGSKVRGATVAAYEELGPEAVYSLQVDNFSAVVAVDLEGRDLFASGPEAYRKD